MRFSLILRGDHWLEILITTGVFFNSWPGYFYWLLLPWKLNILTHFPNRTVLFCSLRTHIHRNKANTRCRSVLHSWRLFLMRPQWWSLPGSYSRPERGNNHVCLYLSTLDGGCLPLVSFSTRCLTMEENSNILSNADPYVTGGISNAQ